MRIATVDPAFKSSGIFIAGKTQELTQRPEEAVPPKEAVVLNSPTGKYPQPLVFENPTNPAFDEANRIARIKYYQHPKL